jgi:ubiquinone/menaquinone biosynthesis C-methylase UbiE
LTVNAPAHLPGWFLRFAFHLLYYQLAWTYDLVARLVSFGQWGIWRRTAMLFLREGPILELGYGTGGLMADMLASRLTAVGLDLSPYMAHLARRRLLRQSREEARQSRRAGRQGDSPPLVRGQAQYLPFPDASFANIVATFPTEFILNPQTLASIARVLQPEGCLVIVVMGYLQGPGPLRRLVEWLYRITGQREIPEPEPLARLMEFGFIPRWERVTLEGATARLLVATHV